MRKLTDVMFEISNHFATLEKSANLKFQRRIVIFSLLDSFTELRNCLFDKNTLVKSEDFFYNKDKLLDIIARTKVLLKTVRIEDPQIYNFKDLSTAMLKIYNIMTDIKKLIELREEQKPALWFRTKFGKSSSIRPKLDTIDENGETAEEENEDAVENEQDRKVKNTPG